MEAGKILLFIWGYFRDQIRQTIYAVKRRGTMHRGSTVLCFPLKLLLQFNFLVLFFVCGALWRRQEVEAAFSA
jgi:hypothetical protein